LRKPLTELLANKKQNKKMNLQSQAENEMPRRTRSKLETHREAIFALRRKYWTYGQIADWLNERGVSTTLTSVYRFCERSVARRPRGNRAPEEPIFIPTPPTTTINKRTIKHRFNLDI
jgi:hypothetical protein